MSALVHRCVKCGHREGKRIVTATSKRSKGVPAAPKLHKKPCNCRCHVVEGWE